MELTWTSIIWGLTFVLAGVLTTYIRNRLRPQRISHYVVSFTTKHGKDVGLTVSVRVHRSSKADPADGMVIGQYLYDVYGDSIDSSSIRLCPLEDHIVMTASLTPPEDKPEE